jgi:hypothetical protein
MRPLADAVIVLISVFASGLLGLSLRGALPKQHLQEEPRGAPRTARSQAPLA